MKSFGRGRKRPDTLMERDADVPAAARREVFGC